MKQEQVFT